MIILTIIIFLIVSVALTAAINAVMGVRIPNNFWDTLKLLCLPYVLYYLLFDKKQLK